APLPFSGLLFRSPGNSAGYPDEEFFEPQHDDYAVALLADSFGVGSVPWSYHFATLAERDLRERLAGRYKRVAIDDRGIVAIDLPEYRAVFDAEVAGHAYRQVVLCLFVGNDFGRGQPPAGGGWRSLVRLQGWLAPEVARRLWLVARGVERLRPPEEPALDAEPAFLADPSLEPPYLTPEAFARVERDRLLYTLAREPQGGEIYRQGAGAPAS